MPTRSQRHKEVFQGYRSPAITGISPDTASIAAAGAVARTVATLSVVGGTPPITYAVVSGGGLSAAMNGNLLQTTVNPCGTAGVKTVSISATDPWGRPKPRTSR